MYILSDSLWNKIETYLPLKNSGAGRPEWCRRKTLEGILFIIRTGAQWRFLPEKYGHKSTVHGKFRKWAKMGVFKEVFEEIRKFYIESNRRITNWSAIDASHSKAPFANWGGRNPTDRGRNGVKKVIIVDINGAPLAVDVGPSNRHDSQLFEESIIQLKNLETGAIFNISGDSAYDSEYLKNLSKKYGFNLLTAINRRRRRDVKSHTIPGRWVVERTFGWFSWYRGIKICWTKTLSSFLSFLQIVASVQLLRMS